MSASLNFRKPTMQHSPRWIILALFTVAFFNTMLPRSAWTSHGPAYKVIKCISFSPQDTSVVFAGAFGWGVFKSTDAGVNWTNMKVGITNGYVRSIHAITNSLVFCGTNDGVFKSTDGAATWSLVLATPFSVRGLTSDPSTGSIYAATFGSGLYKSTNQGSSWASILVRDPVVVDTLSHLWSVAVFGRDSLYVGGSILDIATGGALFRSLDGGSSWIQVQRNVGIRSSVHSIAISPNSPSLSLIIGTAAKGVYKSTNGGLNWTDINGAGTTTNPIPDEQVNAVGFSADYRYAGTDSLGGFYSRSLGDISVGWIAGSGLPGSSAIISSIAINDINNATVFVGTEGDGVYSSTNAGFNWVSRNNGMMGVATRVLKRNGDGRIFLGGDLGDGLWSSADLGTSWSKITSLSTSNAITAIATTTNSSLLYLGAYGSGVFKSTDAGTTWVLTDTVGMNDFVRTLGVNPMSNNILYVGTDNGVFTTTNGGTNWQQVNNGIPSFTSIRATAIDPVDPSVLYVGTDSLYLFKTTNGGTTWTHISNANGFLPQDVFIRTITIDDASHTTLYAGSDSGRVYVSTNSGTNWNLLTQLPATHSVRSILIDPNAHNVMFVSTFGDGIFLSTDAGGHWSTMNVGLTDLEIYTLANDQSDPMTLYAGSGSHGVFTTSYAYANHPPSLASIGNQSTYPNVALHFTVAATDPEGTIPILSATGLPAGTSFVDSGNGHGGFSWVPSPAQIGSYHVVFHASDGTLIDSEQVTIEVLDPGMSTIVSIPAEEGWNLLSVPVVLSNFAKTSAFASATSSAFAFAGSYVARDTLRNGEGYWLKLPSAQTISLGGGTITQETVSVQSNWNLVGSLSHPLPIAAIQPVAPVTITSSVFGYSTGLGYTIEDSIKPGRGYWLRTDQPGSIVISSAAASTMSPMASHLATSSARDNVGVLTFLEGKNSRNLFLSIENSPADGFSSVLPPSPPAGSFDVRFSSSQSTGIVIDPHTSIKRYPIEITTSAPQIALSWNVEKVTSSIEFFIAGDDWSSQYTLKGTGTRNINTHGGVLNTFLIVHNGASSPAGVPQKIRLDQNYPNPFNPATTIGYFLPYSAMVQLTIFDVLGREIRKLVAAEQPSGSYQVQWDAGPVSSGVYFYRLDVVGVDGPRERYREIRKMFLSR